MALKVREWHMKFFTAEHQFHVSAKRKQDAHQELILIDTKANPSISKTFLITFSTCPQRHAYKNANSFLDIITCSLSVRHKA